MIRFVVGVGLAILLTCLANRSAVAAPPMYVVAIGNNQPPNGSEPGVELLQFADDDAAAFYQFLAPFSRIAGLLTVMDPDTQRRFPSEAASARAPTLARLRETVERIRGSIRQDQERGEDSVVFVFFSGHGSRVAGKVPFLAMLDGGLTRETLYEEVLGALPARYIHLFVDACYAEAVVRPRDSDAATVDVDVPSLERYLMHNTLAQFPNVGAIVSSTASSKSHEWDTYGHGVFTHELLSGLRGGADVNGDQKIEYSELYAFLSAANREISDPRAHASIVLKAPAGNGRAPLIDLAQFRANGRIAAIPGEAGHIYLEDQRGNRLADVHAERGAVSSLSLPAGRDLYLRSAKGEAQLRLRSGETIAFDRLALSPARGRDRGSLDTAMRLGLFAGEFGPGYYRGFVDRSADLLPVAFPEIDPTVTVRTDATRAPAHPDPDPEQRRVLFLGLGAARSMISPGRLIPALRMGRRWADFGGPSVDIDAGWGEGPLSEEGRVVVSGGYRWKTRWRSFGISVGAAAGMGAAGERAAGQGWSYTGVLSVAPSVGAVYAPLESWGVVVDLTAAGLLWEQNGGLRTGLLPVAYAGALVRL